MDAVIVVVNAVCWTAVLVVWTALGVRDALAPRGARARGTVNQPLVAVAVVAVAGILLVGRDAFAALSVDAVWVRLAGAAILVASTLFAVRARLSLGGSWSVGPQASVDRGLRTDGPYGVTRHPIYTGLLGMLLGSALLGGLGQWLVLVAAGLVVAAIKIQSEERLLLATFPDAYATYRRRVPMLVPGLRRLLA